MKILPLGALFAAAVFGQAMVSSTGNNYTASGTFRPQQFAMPSMSGAAYSGEEVTEHVQTLEDGTRITSRQLQRKVWRDSQGRLRSERPMIMGPNNANPPMIVEITDPLSRTHWVLDVQNKVAHHMALPELAGRMASAVPMARSGVVTGVISTGSVPAFIYGAANGPGTVPVPPPPPPLAIGAAAPAGRDAARRFTSETLGTKIIDGVLVEGTRTTTVYLAGSIGNDRDFSVTQETWMAPSLKLQVLAVTRDPRSGENTFKIANLSRLEPDPSLFMPPADYSIVEEKEQFTITYKGQ